MAKYRNKILLLVVALVMVWMPAMAGCQCQSSADDLPLREGPPLPLPPPPQEEYVPDQIIVKFKAGTSSEAEAQLNEAMGTSVIYTSPYAGFKVLQIPEGKTVAEMVEAYSKQSIVEYAEPNYIYHGT